MANIDLINWTLQQAQLLTSEPRELSLDAIPPLDEFIALLEGGPSGSKQPSAPVISTPASVLITAPVVTAALADEAVGLPESDAFASPAAAPSKSTFAEEPPAPIMSTPTSIEVTGFRVVIEPPIRDEAVASPKPDAFEPPAADQTASIFPGLPSEAAAVANSRPDAFDMPTPGRTASSIFAESPTEAQAIAGPKPNPSELPAVAQIALSTILETPNEAAVPIPDPFELTVIAKTSPSASVEIPKEVPQPALLMAIRKVDIYTAPNDRDRAIVLRWALRDIKGKRLKLSPVSQADLQLLEQFGLVELEDSVPVLTSAGIRAIN
jgi:hypothetical protein